MMATYSGGVIDGIDGLAGGSFLSMFAAFGVIAFVLFVNSVSVKAAGGLQTLATVCKLTPVALLVIFGLWQGNGQILSVAENASYIVAPFSLALLSIRIPVAS